MTSFPAAQTSRERERASSQLFPQVDTAARYGAAGEGVVIASTERGDFDPYSDLYDERRAFGHGGPSRNISEETCVELMPVPYPYRFIPSLQDPSVDISSSRLSRSSVGYKDNEPLYSPATNGDRDGYYEFDRHPSGAALADMPTLAKDKTTWSEEQVPPDTATDPGKDLSSKRLKSLYEVDEAKWTRFHAKVALIAAVGFFTDAYDIFSINIASIMVAYVYSDGSNVDSSNWLKAATPFGTLIGQVVFGVLADKVGRKRMYGIELIVIIIATFGQALTTANTGKLSTISIVPALFVWRLIMGFGIGGDYPLSAVIASEFAGVKMRGRMMTLVFSAQGWGLVCAALVGYLTLLAFQHSIGLHHDLQSMSPSDPVLLASLDRSWRIIIGLGCVPAALTVYFRLTIPETPRFTMDIERNVKQATDNVKQFLKTGKYEYDPDSVIVRVDAPRASWADFLAYFGRRENAKLLLGCAYAWFAVDVTFYGVGLNTDAFFRAIGFTPIDVNDPKQLVFTETKLHADAVFHYFVNYSLANMFLSGLGLIPGYYAACLLIDNKWVGRKRLQLGGFIVLTVLFAIMGVTYKALVQTPTNVTSIFDIQPKAFGFLALLLITSFFQNCGPNTTTFVVPAELFPTRYRSTAHGISAACGKLGAIVSQFVLAQIAVQHTERTRVILFAFVPFAATGALATFLLVETRGKTLEELSGEEQEHFVHGPVQRGKARELAEFVNM